jgi:hypothetical protein
MHRLVAGMKWVMLVSGLLTFTMVHAAIAPKAALQSSFGETLDGPVADIVVRNWGALIALVGAMLIYGAFHVPSRRIVLVVASLSKVVFVALVVSHGTRFLGEQVGVAVVVDSVMVVLFVGYLIATRARSPD